MNQHLVSRVLLRRWANTPRGHISGLDLDYLTQTTASVERFASLEDLVVENAEQLEQVWSRTIEATANHAISLVEQRLILLPQNAKQLNYLKDLMALHWARSFALTVILRVYQPSLGDQVANNVLRHYSPAQVAHALTGFYVTGFGAEDIVRREISQKLDRQLRSDFLKKQFETHYQEARNRMADFSLEICTATAHELILGDCPVITWDKGRDIAGVLFGATWTDADSIFMAVGPKHLIAVSREGRYRDLNEAEVVTINKLQARAAYKQIYFRPGSELGDKIAEALRTSDRTKGNKV